MRWMIVVSILIGCGGSDAPPPLDGHVSSNCQCAGSLSEQPFQLDCGRASACLGDNSTVRPDNSPGGLVISCSSSAQVTWQPCTLTLIPNCGSCTDSGRCDYFQHDVFSIKAGCFQGRCRMRCDPDSSDPGCNCIRDTPAGGDGRGFCADDGC